MSGATWFCSTYGELNSGWEKQSGREVWGAMCWYRTSPSSDRFGPRFWSDIPTNAFTKSRVVQLFEKYGSAGGSWTSNSAFPFREMSEVLFPPFLPSAALQRCLSGDSSSYIFCVFVWKMARKILMQFHGKLGISLFVFWFGKGYKVCLIPRQDWGLLVNYIVL